MNDIEIIHTVDIFKALCSFNCSACSTVMSIVYDSLQSISSIVNALDQMCQINSKTTNIPLSCACLPFSMFSTSYKGWRKVTVHLNSSIVF